MAGFGQTADLTVAANPTLAPVPSSGLTTSALLDERRLGFKIRLFVYDFTNFLTKMPSCERVFNITNPTSLDGDYFNPAELKRILKARVDTYTQMEDNPVIPSTPHQTVEQMLRELLPNGWKKQPGKNQNVGLDELAAIYASIFGIAREELDNESFVARVDGFDLHMRNPSAWGETFWRRHPRCAGN
ncbi:hypothetical protein F4821DRAFT_261320 [Hypoxylon rubiginosum]|uniref:Uncharacterized protein n=1 Tax=Hypoxylon rubiginosum TaxID=110542 RepID=A0ACC0CXV2_9PEZI|nr:hypothetical protein F4821DRAFT_261320 [Hypoxylon rubiginosum]